jgi:hypothetical protein
MSRLTDPETIRHHSTALSNYRCNGYVVFCKDAAKWLRRELPGWTQHRFAEALNKFVREGGEIDQVVETGENWSGKYAYHYDLRVPIKGRSRQVYVETRLVPDYPSNRDDPIILIANIHDV